MAAFMCIIWGVVSATTVLATQKWYLPKLKLKTTKCEEYKMDDKNSQRLFNIMAFFASIIIAMICGFMSGVRQDLIISVIKMLLVLNVLNIIAITDIELYKIPNAFVVILLAGRILSIISELIFNNEILWMGVANSVIAGIFSLLFLLLMSKITHGGIGYGDIKLFGALGFLCGVRAVVYILTISFFFSAVVSAFFLITKRKRLKDGLPMGPFIWLGFAATIVFGLC